MQINHFFSRTGQFAARIKQFFSHFEPKYLGMIGACLIVVVAAVTAAIVNKEKKAKENQEEYEYTDGIATITYEDGLVSITNKRTGKTIKQGTDFDWVANTKDSLAVFAKDKRRGFINVQNGEIVVKAIYRHAWIFSEGLAAVERENYIGFINPKGEVVIDFLFPYRGNNLSEFVFHDGHCIVADSAQHIGVIDTLGNWVIQPEYDNISLSKEYAIVSKKGDFKKQVDFEGKVLLDCVIDRIADISYQAFYTNLETGAPSYTRTTNPNFFCYYVNGHCGLVDSNGRFITRPIYTDIYGISPTLFRAIMQDYYSEVLINEKGEILSRFE